MAVERKVVRASSLVQLGVNSVSRRIFLPLSLVVAVQFSSVCIAQQVSAQRICVASNPARASVHDPEVDFLIALAKRESGGDQTCVNYAGYLGLFQMGGRALADAGFYKLGPSPDENAWDGVFSERARFADVVSTDTYLSHAGAQELAVRAYHNVQWNRITRLGLSSKVGSVIAGVTLTKSGMIAGSHLVGIGGLMIFVRTNGQQIPIDGSGTPITEYLSLFGSFY